MSGNPEESSILQLTPIVEVRSALKTPILHAGQEGIELQERLEQIRLLTNLETDSEKLLQIILIGQPELRDLLARGEELDRVDFLPEDRGRHVASRGHPAGPRGLRSRGADSGVRHAVLRRRRRQPRQRRVPRRVQQYDRKQRLASLCVDGRLNRTGEALLRWHASCQQYHRHTDPRCAYKQLHRPQQLGSR